MEDLKMKYFVFDNERQNSCYHEFYKGKWDGITFWRHDSIYLHDDFMYGDFEEAIIEVIPTYDPYGETEISKEEWYAIEKTIETKSKKSQEMYDEASAWLKEVFQNYDCLTILGI